MPPLETLLARKPRGAKGEPGPGGHSPAQAERNARAWLVVLGGGRRVTAEELEQSLAAPIAPPRRPRRKRKS